MQESLIINLTIRRNPAYGDELAAIESYNHIDVPNPLAPGPQLFSDVPVDQPDNDSAEDEQSKIVETPRASHTSPEDVEELGTKDVNTQPNESNMDGEGGEDIEAKVERLKDFADDGDMVAQLELANMYFNSEASNYFFEAAKLGNRGARLQMGLMYEQGLLGRVDYDMAMGFYEKAAELGDPEAHTRIGDLYYTGRGVPVDYNRVFHFYYWAAERGHPSALKNIGNACLSGIGIAQDSAQAAQWLRRAAKAGYAPAHVCLGLMYKMGPGVEQSDSTAMEWYVRAAEQGDAGVQFCIGSLYERGRGFRRTMPRLSNGTSRLSNRTMPRLRQTWVAAREGSRRASELHHSHGLVPHRVQAGS